MRRLLNRSGWQRQSLRAGVLSHLACHARRDVTPPHLRTCQCGKSGCPWHRRHRGCAGPIVLSLTHGAHSPTWQLADTCHQCCAAMPSTAAVPEPPAQTASAPRAPAASVRETPWTGRCGTWSVPYEDGDDIQVWETTDATW